MSETSNTNAGTTRTFKTVNGKEYNANGGEGGVTFVRAKDLTEAGTKGIVAEGTLKQKIANQFGGTDYQLETDDGKVVIVNGFGSLNSQMKKVEPGTYLQIDFLGQELGKTGKYKNKPMYKCVVLIAD